MRILHISDIHGDEQALEQTISFANKEGLELICCTGDVLGECIPYLNVLKSHRIFNELYHYMKETQMNGEIDEIIAQLSESSDVPKLIKTAASDYSAFVSLFDKNSAQQYNRIQALLQEFPGAILMIPGNWDSLSFFDYFNKFSENKTSAHLSSFEINELIIAGYGGVSGLESVVPLTREIQTCSEDLYNFLLAKKPNIVLTHTPPYGLCDRIQDSSDSVTSTSANFASLAFLRTLAPDLWLCGHKHEGIGTIRDSYSGTQVVNSGNLGRYLDSPQFGTFSVIDIDENQYVRSVNFYQCTKSGVQKLEFKNPEPITCV